jgi:hypothetical protein
LTKRKNTVKIKFIRHFSPGFQLYGLPLTKSSPQIYREMIKRKSIDNQNYLDITSHYLSKLNIIHGYRSLKCLYFNNSGEPAEKMKGRRGEGWKGGTSGLVKIGGMFFRMKFESTCDIICLLLLVKFTFFHNSGETAAVVNLLRPGVICKSSLPESTAAGLLFCWRYYV